MIYILTAASATTILLIHFWNQSKDNATSLVSNYWVTIYVVGYFLPVPMFLAESDGWTIYWGYPFADKDNALTIAVLTAFAGGIVLSLASRNRTVRILAIDQIHPSPPSHIYSVSPTRIFTVVTIALSSMAAGITLLGGIWELLKNLGDRITFFAGFNAFFLPANFLIGVCFAISGSRLHNNKTLLKTELIMILVTLFALSLLGQKANIYILLVGIFFIKSHNRKKVSLSLIFLLAFLGANAMMMYEYFFREALIIGIDPERLTLAGWTEYIMVQISGNFMQIQNLALLLEAMPNEFAYLFGKTYISIFYFFMPNQLLTTLSLSPLTAAGIYTLTFWPEIAARNNTMPPGLLGEAYINFGLGGFFGICMVLGLAFRSFDKALFSTNSRSLRQLIIHAGIASTSLHYLRGEFFAPTLILVGIILGGLSCTTKSRVATRF